MKKTILALGAVALVAGCATFGQLEEGLNALVGRKDSEAFAALGYPNSKQEYGSDVVYVWGRSVGGVMFTPQTTNFNGTVGMSPVYGTATTNQMVPVSYNCTIKLAVGEDRVIKHWEFDGNLGGCEGYIRRLNDYLKK